MQIPKRKSEQNIKRKTFDPFITQTKYDQIKAEVDKMKNTIRPKLASEVKRLAELGDFSENAEYQSAKGKLRGLNNRILEFEEQLKHCEIIKTNNNNQVVELGNFVTVESAGKQSTYQILGSAETNPDTGIISRNSPLGSALLGKKICDQVEIILRDKTTNFKIISIK